MQRIVRAIFFVAVVNVLLASTALAAAKTYAVLPFSLNGPKAYTHLERAVPQMLTSRLYWAGHFENVSSSAIAGIAAPADDAAAAAALAKSGADYLVYGDVAVIGQESSVDLTVLGTDGVKWMRSGSGPVSAMIPTLKNLADAINTEVFKRPGAAAAPAQEQTKRVNQMNPALTHNQTTGNQEVFLNPQFRYAGGSNDDTRLRSNALRFAASGMAVADVSGDGKNEVVLLSEHDVIVYSFDGRELKERGRYGFPKRLGLLAVRTLDFDRDGAEEIVVSAYDEDLKGRSAVLRFTGNGMEVVAKRIPYIVNVVKLPPEYMPVLIGQKMGKGKSALATSVHELILSGNSFVTGGKISLPEKGNVFNVAWMPSGSAADGGKVIMTVPGSERLRVLTERFGRLSETDHSFSGAAHGMRLDQSLPGLGKDPLLLDEIYYIPIPPVVIDLDDDGRYEVLANKPISVSAQFFERYRFFPQGEIHALFWDGVGLSLQWKTRRIKGSVVAFDVKDVNNDDILDLVVCVNTHPGSLGAKNRKTLVLAYPLDLSKDAANTAIDRTFNEEQ